jgi:hypothetical protein
VLLASAGATAAPYAITYHGTIANSGMPADAPDGAAFTLTLVLDNGASTAAGQSWNIGQITCGFWRWRVDPARSVAVALDMTGGIALGAGNAKANAAGVLTAVFSDVNTGGALAFADYDTSGLPAGASSIGWYADGSAMPFGITAPWGASFDDGSGTPAGGVQMAAGRWSAPQPFTGACDASAVPPPIPFAPNAVPTLSPWGLLLLSALLGLAALRRKILNVFAIYRFPGNR